MTELETEYFIINDPEPSKSGNASIWTVESDHDLGLISWHNKWGKYVFVPSPETFFDANCMRELADFCDRKTREHMASCRKGVTE